VEGTMGSWLGEVVEPIALLAWAERDWLGRWRAACLSDQSDASFVRSPDSSAHINEGARTVVVPSVSG